MNIKVLIVIYKNKIMGKHEMQNVNTTEDTAIYKLLGKQCQPTTEYLYYIHIIRFTSKNDTEYKRFKQIPFCTAENFILCRYNDP